MIRTLLRTILGIRHVVGRDAAVAAAKDECTKRGWPWIEPIHISEGPIEYLIMTNAQMRGGNVYIRVRCRDGRILRASFARR